jgi:hypothetical protein
MVSLSAYVSVFTTGSSRDWPSTVRNLRRSIEKKLVWAPFDSPANHVVMECFSNFWKWLRSSVYPPKEMKEKGRLIKLNNHLNLVGRTLFKMERPFVFHL